MEQAFNALQWGHVFVDVEILSQDLDLSLDLELLQWGHVFVDVEIGELQA